MYSWLLALSAFAGSSYGQSLTQLLQQTPQLSNLTTYLGLTNLASQLDQLTNITVLAPNNDAFTQFLNSSAGSMLASGGSATSDAVTALLSYHVLNGTYRDINGTQFIHTSLMPGQYANVTGGQVVEAMSDNGNFTFISGLMQAANASGNAVNFTGGVAYIVDQVLTLPLNISSTAIEFNLTSAAGALTQTNLTDVVESLTDVTVFVPDNEAFQAIGSALPNLTTEQIVSILEYHVINGTVGYSTALMNGTSLQTVQGNNLTITIDNDEVFVNNARVVVPNVLVANGVVHVVDQVLNPNNTAIANPSASGGSGSPAYSGASSASNPPFTSGVPTPTSAMATTGAAGATGSAAVSGSSGAASSATSNPAVPMKTGAVGAAALFGGAVIALNM